LIVANADRIIDLLHEAKARPAGAERAQFLAKACGDDVALKEQIISLLEAEAKEGESDFLKIAAILRPTSPPSEKPGDRIGRYKLLEQIGEGGCGVVYMAEQLEPMRRRVALKVIKLGMDTKQVIARFEAERQALALMDHPNIAKIFDAGVTGAPVAAGVSPAVEPGVPPGGTGVDNSKRAENSVAGPGGKMPPSTTGETPAATLSAGRPFFVMELVRGIKITDYCDQNNLSTNERLELFIQVCQAIQHAHQKGIIHRDIKPSNILVTQHDDVAVPKVIDFGIAKATTGQLTDKTVFTAFAQFIGTPAYMSPEQAQMSGLDVDTRSDIYSLGVLLYELLTGNTPFDAKELLAAGMDEMRRKIREDEPPKPSTCLSTMQAMDLTTVAKRRHVEPPRLIHLIRGDLDWLVMKCLEKDRTRRYETANGLAMDLQRHLNNEPVTACPPSRWYEFQKTVRRHKFGFAAAAAVTAALALGFGMSTWMFFKEKHAHQRAVAAEQEQLRLRREAEAEVAESRRIATFIGDLSQTLGQEGSAAKVNSAFRVSVAMQLRMLGKEHREVEAALSTLAHVLQQRKIAAADATAREAAQKCRAALAQFEALASDPNRRQDCWLIALGCEALGHLFRESGQIQEAEKVYRDTQVLWRKLVTDYPSIEDYQSHLAVNYDLLGDLLKHAGRPAESLEAYRAAQTIWFKLVAEFDTEDRRIHLGWTDDNIGQLLTEARRFDEAAEAHRRALDVWKRLVADFDRDAYRNYLSGTLLNLATTLEAVGKQTEAELLMQEAESAIRERLPKQRKELGRGHAEVISTVIQLSKVLGKLGKFSEQESVMREQLGMDAYPTESAQMNLGHLLWQQGDLSLQRNEFTKAAQVYDQAALTFKQLQSRFPENRHYRQEEAFSLRLLSDASQRMGRLAEAEANLRTACDIYRQLAKELPNSTFYAQEVTFTRGRVAEVLSAQGKHAEAEAMCRDDLAAAKQRFGEIHRNVDQTLVSLARVLQKQGKLAEAEAVQREELAVERKLSGEEHLFVANSLISLASVLYDQKKLPEAETAVREALAMRRKLGGEPASIARSLAWLAAVLEARGKLAEAEPVYRDQEAMIRKLSGDERLEVAAVLAKLTVTLLAQDKFSEAESTARECLAIREKQIPDGWLTFNAQCMLGGSLLGQKKYAEAERLLLSGYEGMKQREDRIPAVGKIRLQESLQRLVQLYDATGQVEKAAEWKQRLAEFKQTEAGKKTAAPKP